MGRVLSALGAGLLFGIGLIVAGMSNPAKVRGFLDLAGAWDPSLALVMAGAIAVATPAFLLAGRRGETVLGGSLALPTTRAITPRLLLGSLLFGSGWGLVGLCPGPALVLAGTLAPEAVLFMAAMLVGMLLFSGFERRRA
ncbi:hypothetical protein OL229_11965 [Neisseriaceae bacterium JH1-16]|nr:hypothetical protein [Neisseriaceae bacterium JH1-16]